MNRMWIVALVVLTGCRATPQESAREGWVVVADSTHKRIYRVDDLRRGTTCYVAVTPRGAGIDCLEMHK